MNRPELVGGVLGIAYSLVLALELWAAGLDRVEVGPVVVDSAVPQIFNLEEAALMKRVK